MKYIFIFLTFTHSLFSEPISLPENSTCSDIKECIELHSRLTGAQYILDKDIKGGVALSKNLKLTKDNIDKILFKALSMAGLTRVNVEKNVWTIINARDIRYTPTQILNGDTGNIPNNDHYLMATFKIKHLDVTDVVRNFRPFMTRYGRILDIKRSNMLIITDTGSNINRLKKLIPIIDIPLTLEQKREQKERRRHKEKLELEKAKNCTYKESKDLRAHSSKAPTKHL